VSIKLNDYSFYCKNNAIEDKKLYKRVKENGVKLILDTSSCYIFGNSDNNENEPIIEISVSNEENYVDIITYGYVGDFFFHGTHFDISYRFGELLLDRMIGVVNDFDIITLKSSGENNKKTRDNNITLKILCLNFILQLEKLSVIGLPKSYIEVKNNNYKFKGRIDVNQFIKKNLPFTGNISSIYYEQAFVQEIIDVLNDALNIIELNDNYRDIVFSRLFEIRNLLKHYASDGLIDYRTLKNAIHHQSIQNSLYSDFKPLLEIAKYILLKKQNFKFNSNKPLKSLMFNVSLLWEKYLYLLLKKSIEKEFDDWVVIHEEKILVYPGTFCERHLYPDIVIKNEKEKRVIVLDAKSKNMTYTKGIGDGARGDVDRSDFFQINTYMSYYNNSGYTVLAGGLLYPITSEIHSDSSPFNKNWFKNNQTKFIIDGIGGLHLSGGSQDKCDMSSSEKNFLDRIHKILVI
jgi:5-methylcytosine-specific restriction endonuclease McrBC regulatory subunit McrC